MPGLLPTPQCACLFTKVHHSGSIYKTVVWAVSLFLFRWNAAWLHFVSTLATNVDDRRRSLLYRYWELSHKYWYISLLLAHFATAGNPMLLIYLSYLHSLHRLLTQCSWIPSNIRTCTCLPWNWEYTWHSCDICDWVKDTGCSLEKRK